VTWKGVDQIIESVAKLNATLLVVGDGPERLKLERLAQVLEAKVSFVGQVPEGEVSNLINRSSVFVLNSNFEATSYALLEAQASELIVIANEGTGSEEVIKHGESGYLCGPNSGIDLLEAMGMARVLNSENAIIRKNARESVIKEFNLDVNYERILRLCTQ
jgi:glycosyltransferase involved in cell wall biosynthesis